MRKTLAAAAVLLLMPLALLLAADAALRGTEEAVEIRETVLSGDRSAARGVDLTFHVQSEGHLFWDTAVSLGTETLLPETVFAFSQWERREEEPFVPWAEISISGTNYGISSSGGIDFAEERWVSRELMLLPAADVAERTAAGETREEVVALGAYYTCYPLYLDVRHQSRAYVEFPVEEQQKLTDYFQVAIPPEHTVRVSVTKDRAGNVAEVNCQDEAGAPKLCCQAAAGRDGVYVYLSTLSDRGEPVDLIRSAGGSGVYFIPMVEQEQAVSRVRNSTGESLTAMKPDTARIRLVRSLDAGLGDSESLSLGADGSRLLLYTAAGGTLSLSVLDAATGETVQELTLLEDAGADAVLWTVHRREGFQLAALSDGSFALVLEERNVCRLALTGRSGLDTDYGYDILFQDPVLAWDGTRLVCAANSNIYRLDGTYLAVFDRHGTAFAARYDHSIGRDSAARGSSTYRFMAVEPLTVAFAES